MKPECRIDEFGTKVWCIKGQIHREDGPAVEYKNGYKVWYINNQRHREDGPAIIYSDNERRWFLNGREYIIENWIEAISKMKKISKDEIMAKYVLPYILS